jgi:hypothetical protein
MVAFLSISFRHLFTSVKSREVCHGNYLMAHLQCGGCYVVSEHIGGLTLERGDL